MKALKSKRIFILIWIVIGISGLATAGSLIKGMVQFAVNPLLFWMTVLRMLTMIILLIMGLSLWKIVKAYTTKTDWKDNYYQKVKQMGYWAIVLTVLNAAFQVGYEAIWQHIAHPGAAMPALFSFRRFYAALLMESPAMWILTLSIFLFAELLNSAHQVKAENEAFI